MLTSKGRADRAGEAIEAYSKLNGSYGEDNGTKLADMLADMLHWAHANGVHLHSELERAEGHFSAELADEDESIGDER